MMSDQAVSTDPSDRTRRLIDRAEEWGVIIEESFETSGAHFAFGRRGQRPVVLKVLKTEGDEWRSGEALSAFDGRGVARVYEHAGGALLMERLSPGYSLVDFTLSGRDEDATTILARVIRDMEPARSSPSHPTVQEWGKAFSRYSATGDEQIPAALVSRAHTAYADLCASQKNVRLLHGDLQHSNVLFDRERGWLAIDAKGVTGEVEYEIGPALRNPHEAATQFTTPAIVERRVGQFVSELGLDRMRTLKWAFAQAVLSAIWVIEDEGTLGNANRGILLAESIWPMISASRA